MLILFLKLKEYKGSRKVKNKDNDYFKEHKYLKNLLKLESVAKIDIVLKEAGYPISTNKYLLFTTLAILTAIFLLFKSGLKEAVLVAAYLLIPLNVLIYRRISDYKNKIRMSLCDIQDIFYFQGQIGTPSDVILANAAKIAEEPLKKPFEEASSIYNLTRNMDKALEQLENSFNLMDIKALCISIKQREETGYSEENHKAQLIMMKRNKRLKKRSERQDKRTKLFVCAILLFLCCSAIIAIPMIKDVLNSVNMLLR